jgi:hypothetical protein
MVLETDPRYERLDFLPVASTSSLAEATQIGLYYDNAWGCNIIILNHAIYHLST